MPAIDTNVLVRWLIEDDERQTASAQLLFESARSRGTLLFVPVTVMLELEWVLRWRYRFDKATISGTLGALLETQELEFQDEAAVERALHACRAATAEFADCLHAGLCSAAGQTPLLTFDDKAAHLPGVEPLTA